MPLGLPRIFVDRLHVGDVSLGEKAAAELGIKEAEFAMEGGLGDPRGVHFKIGPVLVRATLAPPLTAVSDTALVLDYEGSTLRRGRRGARGEPDAHRA